MPSVSQAQNRAMHAAAEGHSTLGIPKKVGEDYIEADHGRAIANLQEHVHHPGKHSPPKRKP